MANRVRVFVPCYQIPIATIRQLVQRFQQLSSQLMTDQCRLDVLFIDDGSGPDSAGQIEAELSASPFIQFLSHDKNMGNCQTVVDGYRWAVQEFDEKTLIGCCDGDGEHDPLSFVTAIENIGSGICDSVLGSIDYAVHCKDHPDMLADYHMMLSLAADQSRMLNLSGRLSVHSPGFQLHRATFAHSAIRQLPKYFERYAVLHQHQPGFQWGVHYVIAQLAVAAGARIQAMQLPCLGPPPGRTPQKRWNQTEASIRHLQLFSDHLESFKNSAQIRPR